MDEVECAIRGKVEDWRYQRRAALVSGNFKKGTTETEIYSLPFDDELSAPGFDAVDYYNNANTHTWN